MFRDRIFITLCVLAVLFAGCSKQNPDQDSQQYYTPKFDDARYLLDALVEDVDGVLVPMYGVLDKKGILTIPATSVFGAERHFRSLFTPNAKVKEKDNSIIWTLTDDRHAPQGEAVFRTGSGLQLKIATVSLPDGFPVKGIDYKPADTFGLADSVDPDVREDLEDNYFYGAIVDIPDYGCGSGKFVVFREYDFETGENGMAVRVDSHRWTTSEYNYMDNAGKVVGRASCLTTLKTAGAIYRSDRNILSKQLRNAGCTVLDQHYFSDSKNWMGSHYYYCLHDDECDTIGPINDTEFYECWIYWFLPEGDHIRFW